VPQDVTSLVQQGSKVLRITVLLMSTVVLKGTPSAPKLPPPWLWEQAWARMEEGEGALQRADELRNFRMQQRTELVLPSSFAAGLELARPTGAPLQGVFNMVRLS